MLAFVLGRMAEESLRQSLLLSHGRFDILFTVPLATILLVIALTVMVLPAIVPPSSASSARSGKRRAPGP